MAAEEHLNGQQFFHGSNQEFQPGDYINPGVMVPKEIDSRESKGGSNPGRWSNDFKHLGHDQFVWMTKNPENASYGKNFYQVEPEGLTHSYSHELANGGSRRAYENTQTHVSLAPVKVLRRGKLAGPHPDNPNISKIEWDD